MLAFLLVCGVTAPAQAYTDGDRLVEYYSFNIATDNAVGVSSNSMKRLYNRQWVVSVSSRMNNSYPITYGMIRTEPTDFYSALVSNTTSKSGTGNFGSTYYNTLSVSQSLKLAALVNANDVNKNVRTNGQWSTDASK